MSKINLFETETLLKIRDIIIQGNTSGMKGNLDQLMSAFPFYQLVEIGGMHHDAIKAVCNIMVFIVESDEFINNNFIFKHSIEFILRNLNFLIKQDNCGDTFYAVLDLLRTVLFRLKSSEKCAINSDTIINIIIQIINSPQYLQAKYILCCCDLFIGLLSLTNLNFQDTGEFVQCVTQLVSYVDDTLTTLKMVNSLLLARRLRLIPELEIMYTIAEMNIHQINKETPKNILTEFFKCISIIYTICKIKKTLQILTKEVIKKFDIICVYLKIEEYKSDCSKIMEGIIENIFYDTPWKGENSLISEIQILANSTNWCYGIETDVIFIVFYLEFIYLEHSGNDIFRRVMWKLRTNIPTNPPVIKSIYLLYSAYMATRITVNKGNTVDLLGSLQSSEQIAEMLTYHISQLIWILFNGSDALKVKVLNLWLKNHDTDNDILVSLKACDESKLLIDVILKTGDDDYRNRAADMLIKLKDKSIAQLLMESIPHAIGNHVALGYILKCYPALPQDQEMSVIIVNELALVMPLMKDVNCIKGACIYGIQLLWQLRDKHTVTAYLNVITIKFLLMICNYKDDQMALVALKLLKFILRLQGKHELNTKDSIAVDFGDYLKGSNARIKLILQLLQTIIKAKHMPIVKLLTPSLSLYLKLLQLRNTVDLSDQIYKTIIYLFRLQTCLATSMHNTFVVKFECSQRGLVRAGFVTFLRNWLTIVHEKKCYNIPISEITQYLKFLDDKYQREVLIITNILNKWQTLPPDSSNVVDY